MLAARDPSQDLLLDGRHVHAATDGCGVEVQDLETGEIRRSRLADVAAIARVADALDEVSFHWVPVSAQDMPPESRALHELAAIWRNSTKHVQTESIVTPSEVAAAIEMAAAIAGGREALRERPVLSIMQCTISPLAQDGAALEAALLAVEAGLPTGFMTMASCAFTGPATPAGTLVVGNAEVISALAMLQLAAPGAPVYYAAAQTAIDLRSGAYTGGGPEDFLFGAATNALAELYRVPLSMGAFATGAKSPDWQAGLENGLSTFPASASGADMLLGLGLLHGSRMFSFEQLLLDAEIYSIVRSVVRGIAVDDEALALDAIRAVGPNGDFLTQPHTRRHMRELWQSRFPPPTVQRVVRGPRCAPPVRPGARSRAARDPPARAARRAARRRARAHHHRRRARGRPGAGRHRRLIAGPAMRPTFQLLSPGLVERVLAEAFELLEEPGIKVQAPEALALLAAAGASVDGETARLPAVWSATPWRPRPGRSTCTTGWASRRSATARASSSSIPAHPACGSSTRRRKRPRTSESADLVRLVHVAEGLPAYAAQSTAVVCHDVPAEIGDLYRLFIVLLHSDKPVVTGAFRIPTIHAMIDLLAIDAGGPDALAARPRAVFDVCSSPPLTWADLGGQNLIDLARARVPAELIWTIAGAAAPVTLIGAVVQHAAETLSGIVIHQLAGPGAPVVWGGAPAILDMRSGATAMGAIETAMIDAAYAQVGRSLGLPTHGYLSATDAKLVDAQSGLESGTTAMLGALAGIDLISGAGMLDFLLTQSAEKLVVDAEGIGMVQRLLRGVGHGPVGTEIAGGVPLIGDPLLLLLRGGPDVTGATMSRFFGIHVLVLPLILAGMLVFHLALVHQLGLANPKRRASRGRRGARR